MLNNSLVTIAIPFYNAQQYLSQAIDSVINQTYDYWQLLLLDDGSTDESLKIARLYAAKDSRIVVYSDGKNKNLGYRLNQIAFLSDTIYLARMDADDIMHPQRIEKQLQIMQQHPEIDVLGTNAYSIDENNMVLGIRNQNFSQELLDVNSFIHPTILGKTEWFRNNNYDAQALRIEDTELWYRTNKVSCFKVITEPLLFYREVGDGYYKKYFKANGAKSYILQKYKNEKFWKKFFIKNIIKGVIYYIFNLLGKEIHLIVRRNDIILQKESLTFYIK